MSLREFLRGGYQEIRQPTMILRRGIPFFSVHPHGTAPAADRSAEEALRNEASHPHSRVV